MPSLFRTIQLGLLTPIRFHTPKAVRDGIKIHWLLPTYPWEKIKTAEFALFAGLPYIKIELENSLFPRWVPLYVGNTNALKSAILENAPSHSSIRPTVADFNGPTDFQKAIGYSLIYSSWLIALWLVSGGLFV
mgnify:FL=1